MPLPGVPKVPKVGLALPCKYAPQYPQPRQRAYNSQWSASTAAVVASRCPDPKATMAAAPNPQRLTAPPGRGEFLLNPSAAGLHQACIPYADNELSQGVLPLAFFYLQAGSGACGCCSSALHALNFLGGALDYKRAAADAEAFRLLGNVTPLSNEVMNL